jgi:predicted  nucleic acid-binding Zn-ribbon protein
MRTIAYLVLLLALIVPAIQAPAQQSDYEIQQGFEQRYNDLRMKVDSASTTAELDSLNSGIGAFAKQYQDKREFLDKALYPETFEGRINTLRHLYQVAHDRVSTIQTQGVRIGELQKAVAELQVRLDTLTGERARLFDELQQSRRSESQLREAVRRLTSNLQANDRLVFSLLDSLFLPYDRNLSQSSEVEKENVASNLERASVLRRIRDVANDNVRFLEATQLQGKDYANLLDQYQQFQNRWKGLSDKLQDVVTAAEREAATPRGKAKGAAKTAAAITSDRTQVDSAVAQWHQKLQAGFWSAVEKEFTSRGVAVNHFVDAPSFDASMRAYIAAAKEGKQDPSVFVDQVWKERIDKEWRDALTRESMLGKTGYASLDKAVSELSQKKIDLRLILYIVVIVAIALAAWWFISRKPKSKADTEPAA